MAHLVKSWWILNSMVMKCYFDNIVMVENTKTSLRTQVLQGYLILNAVQEHGDGIPVKSIFPKTIGFFHPEHRIKHPSRRR